MASAAVAAAAALGGCQTDGTDLSARALTPIPPKLLAEMEQKNMNKDAPILVRIFKEEAELEVWKQDRTGHYALLKTYPICRWSGELGPKLREGDRQAPEGFYSITPAQMNPKSRYYLAFNMGYPNAYDRAWGRTGAELMIHGDCSSRGCYAMTDEQIAEIYALGREAFFGGQRAFQVQAYPFRMTPMNLARHRNNPNMAFWKMLKRGNDHFEVTRLEPKVDVCEKRYVFDAYPPAGSSTPLKFNPTGKCPEYEVPADIVAAVNEKQRSDEYQTAELIARGTKASPIRTGTDGGMHPVFLAALQGQDPNAGSSPFRTAAMLSTPVTLPRHVVPPRVSPLPAAVVEKQPAEPPRAQATAALSQPTAQRNSGLFSTLYAGANSRGRAAAKDATGTVPTATVPSATGSSASAPSPATARAVRPSQTATTPAATETKEHSAKSAEPPTTTTPQTVAASASPPSSGPSTMPPAGSFESRWLAITSRSRF
ncbi:MAG TPA: L,D-transpeptidase family protein [Xanthobacteraceae bacterium]|nr:L,D-transpeptidase family protein [Xanthobacteraceae bacterium]